MPRAPLNRVHGIAFTLALMLVNGPVEAQTRGPGTVGYTAAERREVDRRFAAEFGLTNRAIQSAISSLGLAEFNIQNPQHRELLSTKLRALTSLRYGQFSVLNRSALISANPSLRSQAQAAIISFDAGNIQHSINQLLPLHKSLLAFPNGLNDYSNVTQLVAALYRSSGRSRLADDFINKCEANAAWARSKGDWSSIMCTAQAAISRAVASGAPSDLKLALASINQSAALYQSSRDSLPWEIEKDLFEAAALNLAYEAPSEATKDVLELGEKLLRTYQGRPSDHAYLDLQATLALFYGYAANFGAMPQHFQRAQDLIGALTPPASAPNFLRYRIAQAQCAIKGAQYSQGLGPDPAALVACENALRVAERSGFSGDCIIDAQLQVLDTYFGLAATSTDGQATQASYDLLDRIFEDNEKRSITWPPVQSARLEYSLARQGMQILDRLPPVIAATSIARMQAIDSSFAKSRKLLFDAGYNPYRNSWAVVFVAHQAQTNARMANVSFASEAPANWPSAAERRETAMEVLSQLRKGYGAGISTRMEAVFEFMTSALVLEGQGQPADTLLNRILFHEERLQRLATQVSDVHIYDRFTILQLLTMLKERGAEIDATRIEPHLTIIQQWQAGPRASTIPVPNGLIPWISKTFGLPDGSNSLQ